jgi:hypothetical protein
MTESVLGGYTKEDLLSVEPKDAYLEGSEPIDVHEYKRLVGEDDDTISAQSQRIVSVAETQIGVRESGGANRGLPYERYVRPFGAGPSPWCAFFVSWCYWKGTGARPPWSAPGYVPSIQAWARSSGNLTRTPVRGGVFGIGGSHIGLIAARLRQGRILTVEGNYSDAVLSVRRTVGGLWFSNLG